MAKILYKKVKKLAPVQSAYISALIDGEGTITLYRIKRNEYRELGVEISNGDFELLKQVKRSVGAGQITLKRPQNKKHAISYTYKIRNRQALNLLMQISPYLKTYKRKRAELVLKNYIKLTPRNGKYSPELLAKKEKFIKAFFSISSPRKIRPELAAY